MAFSNSALFQGKLDILRLIASGRSLVLFGGGSLFDVQRLGVELFVWAVRFCSQV